MLQAPSIPSPVEPWGRCKGYMALPRHGTVVGYCASARTTGQLEYEVSRQPTVPTRRYCTVTGGRRGKNKTKKNCLPCMGSAGPVENRVLSRTRYRFLPRSVCLPGRTGTAAVASLSLAMADDGIGVGSAVTVRDRLLGARHRASEASGVGPMTSRGCQATSRETSTENTWKERGPSPARRLG